MKGEECSNGIQGASQEAFSRQDWQFPLVAKDSKVAADLLDISLHDQLAVRKAKGERALQMDLEHLINVPIELPESQGVCSKAQQKAKLPNEQEQLAFNKANKKT